MSKVGEYTTIERGFAMPHSVHRELTGDPTEIGEGFEFVQTASADSTSNARQLGSLKAPFLNIRFLGPCNATQSASSNDELSPIRNNHLFGLGVILLGLDFESPLKELHSAQDQERGPEHEDYLAARRLRTTIGTPLSSRYGRIAKRCLDCELNVVEHDLRDSNLQAAFFKDVL